MFAGSAWVLMEVPPDIYQVILSYCDVAEVLSTGTASRSVYDLSSLDLVWRPFYRDRWEGEYAHHGHWEGEPVNEGLSFRDMVSVGPTPRLVYGPCHEPCFSNLCAWWWRAVRAALLP